MYFLSMGWVINIEYTHILVSFFTYVSYSEK